MLIFGVLSIMMFPVQSVFGHVNYSISLQNVPGVEAVMVGPKPGVKPSEMGNCGYLLESGKRYPAKCDGAGMTPEIVRSGKKNKHGNIKFKTDPNVKAEGNDRSEVAITEKYFPFDQDVFIGFNVMIPTGAAVANAMFMLMQLWQCGTAPPIAGLRMMSGSSHRFGIMSRNNPQSGSTRTAFDVIPGKWYGFVIRFRASRTDGAIEVWREGSNESELFSEEFGYDSTVCPEEKWRLKFGIYKANEPGRYFEVNYDDVRVGDSRADVQPWKASTTRTDL